DQLRSRVWRSVNVVPRAGKCVRLADACREYRRGSHADDYPDRLRARGVLTSPHAAGRDGAQHRVYYAADDVAGERRSAHGADPDLDFRFNVQRYRQSGGAYRDCDDRTAGDCAAVPSLDDHSAAGWGYRPRGRGGADANAYRPVAAGRVPDGDGHHDYRPAQFCRINGAAYRPYDGLPQDFAAYRDLCADGRSDPGLC